MSLPDKSDAERDAQATALAEQWWPNRYVGDLTSFEWDRVYHEVDRARTVAVSREQS